MGLGTRLLLIMSYLSVILFILNTRPVAVILESPQTQYVLVNDTATFHCKTHGARDTYWVINGTAITISHPDEKTQYESLNFSFSDSSGANLTINVSASESVNNTCIFYSILHSDFAMT